MPSFKAFLGISIAVTFILNRYYENLLPSRNLALAGFWIFVVQGLAWFAWRCILYPKYLSPLRTIPGPSGGNLLMGHRLMMLKEPNGQLYRQWQNEIPNDGIIRYLDLFNNESIVPLTSKALAEVTVQKAYDFIKPPQLIHGLGKILGFGIFLAEGDEHKRQRKDLSPAFAFRHIKDLYPIFWSKGSEMVEALSSHIRDEHCSNGEAGTDVDVDVNDWTSRTTLDIIGVAGLGHDFNSIKDPTNDLIITYKKIFSASRTGQILGILRFFFPRWLVQSLPISHNDDIEAASQVIQKVCYKLVKQAKQRKLEDSDKSNTKNILSVAIESDSFSDSGLVNQLMTFLIAGHETSASAVSWAICLLCTHSPIQTRLREEVRSNLPDPRSHNSAGISTTVIDKLPYLNAVCNEVLRLYSPVPVTVRVAACDTSILGHAIPKGTSVFLSPWATNCNKEMWGDDAEQFNPDRWLSEDGRASKTYTDNYALLTFLHGPRSCIGQGFARGEFAVLLAAWVGCFETEFVEGSGRGEVRNGLAPRPKDLRVRLRETGRW